MTYLKKISALGILLISSTLVFAQNFNINGTVAELNDGTWLYLRAASPDKILDSAQVLNGKFKLSGKMNEKITRVYLHTAKYADYTSFWMEGSLMEIHLKKGEFRKATITGSKTEEENKLLTQLMAPVDKKMDSLTGLIQLEKNEDLKNALRNQRMEANKKRQEIEMSYVERNPNSLISANLLAIYSTTWGKLKTQKLYESLSTTIKNTSHGKEINNFILLNEEIKVGGKFADFEQENSTGKKVKLSDIKGKYILLEFWGSWCGPCRAENPNLVKTYTAYKDKGFEILGVAAETNKAQWLKAIKDDKLPWENVSDLKGDNNVAALIYGINAYPTNFLIDEKGIIIAKNLRGMDLEKKLAELLP